MYVLNTRPSVFPHPWPPHHRNHEIDSSDGMPEPPLHNAHGQPLGRPLLDWTLRPRPSRVPLHGRTCHLEPLNSEQHAAELYDSYGRATDDSDWTYLPFGPFDNEAHFRAHVEALASSTDTIHFAVIDEVRGRAVGTLALMRCDPSNGVVEVGYVTFSPLLKGSVASTEAQFLLMRNAFELGYRRYEWKCDSLNAPSRRAAERLGFTFEGVFRNATVYKGRSRDTAWFSITDLEWPVVRDGFQRWLCPSNFDVHGHQRRGLADLRLESNEFVAEAGVVTGVVPIKKRPAWRIAELTEKDHAAWLTLWHGYQTFYQVVHGEQMESLTWTRVLDAAEPMFALGAFSDDDTLLGIAHGILHLSTSTAGPYLYLQDLFTVEAARGQGIGRALIEAVYDRGRASGVSRVYWMTHESNLTARALYDKVANNAGFVQYRKEVTQL